MSIEASDSQDLLDQARGGDADAYCELSRIYEASLVRQATALCGNFNLGETLAQETLVEAWRNLYRFNGHCQFFTWLCAILLNRYRNTLRRKQLLSFLPFTWHGEEFDHEPVVDEGLQPDQVALAQEQSELVRKCVQALPDKQRQVVYLRFYVDESLEGIAEALGISVGTVKSRLFNALERLRGMKEMNAQSVACSMKAGSL